MVFSIQDIVQECVDKVADMRSGGAQEKIPVLWDGFTRLIHQNVQGGRGVNVPKFGKFTVMQFNEAGLLVGAQSRTYLLEKSRILAQSEGERDYHVFYQVRSYALL